MNDDAMMMTLKQNNPTEKNHYTKIQCLNKWGVISFQRHYCASEGWW